VSFTLAIADEMSDASYSPDQVQIASTGWTDAGTAEVRLWNATTGALLQALSMGTAPISHTLWSSQGILFANDWGGVVRAWTRQSDGRLNPSSTWSTAGSATGTMPGAGELGRSVALAVSPQGTGLVAGGMDPATNAHGFMFLSM
jgi:WD40 repeat protein